MYIYLWLAVNPIAKIIKSHLKQIKRPLHRMSPKRDSIMDQSGMASAFNEARKTIL